MNRLAPLITAIGLRIWIAVNAALAAASLAALVLPITALSARAADTDSLEYAIKATYLYKFAPFVEWPDGAFGPDGTPFTICVVGMDPFGDLLDRAVKGQRVGEHPIIVRRLTVAARDTGCQIMYIGGSPSQSVAQALESVRGTPILTITEQRGDSAQKGVINFVISDNRVRFEIDANGAAGQGLTISSKLLSLAISVVPRS